MNSAGFAVFAMFRYFAVSSRVGTAVRLAHAKGARLSGGTRSPGDTRANETEGLQLEITKITKNNKSKNSLNSAKNRNSANSFRKCKQFLKFLDC